MIKDKHMHVYKELQSVGTRKGTNILYVSSHNMGSYIKVSVIWYMYTCEYMHVYKEALSVSTRKGTDICEFAQHGVIYKSICNMKYVYLWVYVNYVCIQRGSRCEHSQGHKHMLACTTWAYIQKYLWWKMYTCEHMYVCKEVLSASARKGTDICEFAQHGVIYKSICNMKYVYLWVYVNVCIQRGSRCEHSQGHKHMLACTTWAYIQKYLWWKMYTCEHVYVCKEVLSASTRKGTNICEFAQHGVIYKSICNMKYVFLWVYVNVCIQRGSKCEHLQGHRHMWVWKTSVIQEF